MHVKLLSPSEAEQALERLSEILVDAVAHGAGVSFMHPLSQNDAHNYWRAQMGGVALHQTFIFLRPTSRLMQRLGDDNQNTPEVLQHQPGGVDWVPKIFATSQCR